MKAIILAAGNGKRLSPYTNDIPKCLLDLGGVTILENQLNSIGECGIDDVVIVTGYKSEKIEQFLRDYRARGVRINTIYNPFYRETNSLVSLWIARGEMNRDFVVMNGDDVFEIGLLEKVLETTEHSVCLPVKIKDKYDDEDMKMVISGDRISMIDKNLTCPASGESVGVRVFRNLGVPRLKMALEEEIRTRGATEKWYVSAVQRLIDKGYKVSSVNIEELFWMDVDYPDDLLSARRSKNKFLNGKKSSNSVLKLVKTG